MRKKIKENFILNFKKLFLQTFGLYLIVFGSLTFEVKGKELFRDYRSASALGKGNTGIAVTEGSESIFYNPAGMSQGKGIFSELVVASPMVSFSQNVISIFKSSKAGKEPLDIVQENYGKPIYAGVQNLSALVFRRVGVGVLEQFDMTALAQSNPITGIPEASLDAVGRIGVYTSFSKDFVNQKLFLGTTLKVVNKNQSQISIDALQYEQKKENGFEQLIKDSIRRGSGFGMDFGVMAKPFSSSPFQLGINLRNIGMNYNLGVQSGKKAPDSDPLLLDLGFALLPASKKSEIKLLLDFKDAMNKQQTSIYRRLHLGAEINFLEVVGLMAGLNQGYPTYGLYLNLKFVRLDAGIYTEELGERAGQTPNKRIFAQISTGWL